MTVTGPVDTRDVGIVLPHEHLLANLYRVTGDPNHLLNDRELAVDELKPFREAGGTAIVDCTSLGLGRDPDAIRWISERSKVHVVMGCGWYRQSYYDGAIERRTVDSLAADMIRDIEHGAGSEVRAGIIGEIGSDLDYVSPAEERVLRAAARAQLSSGLTLFTHAARSAVGLAQLDILEDEGVPLDRVVIGHCDTHPEPAYHRQIAERGAFVAFDTIRGNAEWDTRARIGWITALRDEGFLHSVLLSHDVCMRSHLRAYGGGGYAYIPTVFAEMLRDSGFTVDDLQLVLRLNPLKALTGVDHGEPKVSETT